MAASLSCVMVEWLEFNNNKIKDSKMQIYKNAYGNWTAENTVKLENNQVLKIVTMKRFTGRVTTTATVYVTDGDMLVNLPFQDFSKTILTSEGKMTCTEKSIRAFHVQAMMGLQAILKEVKQFYINKAAEEAA